MKNASRSLYTVAEKVQGSTVRNPHMCRMHVLSGGQAETTFQRRRAVLLGVPKQISRSLHTDIHVCKVTCNLRRTRSYELLIDSGYDNDTQEESENYTVYSSSIRPDSGSIQEEDSSGCSLTRLSQPNNDSSSLHLDPDFQEEDRLRLNVSGIKVEASVSVFRRFPESLLGNPFKRARLWDPTHKEYFLDRHRPTFEAIFQFYQTGHLKRPIHVPMATFLEELEKYQFRKDIIDSFRKNEGLMVRKETLLPKVTFQRKLWLLFEYPESSRPAKAVGVTSVAFILLSIVSFCVETLPVFANSHCYNNTNFWVNGAQSFRLEPNYRDQFFIMESCCIMWFTMEFFIRFFSCPSKRKFLKNILNIIDFITLIPYFVILSIVTATMSCDGAKGSASLLFLRVLRIFRVFKLSKHSSGLRVLGLTMKASLRELGLFLFFLVVGAVVFAGAIFYAEADQKGNQISSIPDGIWWSVVTMTTVGYGDIVPVGIMGKVVGTICVIMGVLTLALPAPVIVANFNHFYKRETGRGFNPGN